MDNEKKQRLTDEEEKRIFLISENLKKLLNDNGMKQTDLARAIDLKPSTIGDYINRRSAPSFGVIQRMADFFGVKKTDIDAIWKEDPKYYSEPYKECNYIDATKGEILPNEIDPFTSKKLKKIPIAESLLGDISKKQNLLMVKVNGTSMNKIFNEETMVAVEKVDDFKKLKENTIVAFSENGKIDVNRIYINHELELLILNPNSNDKNCLPKTFQLSNMTNVKILGKVIFYTINLE